MPLKTLLLASTFIVAVLPASAEEKRALGAHVHGHGALNVAIEGTTLALELETPGFDLVGFEHAAESEQDKKAIQSALDKLSDPALIFAVPQGAGCSLVEAVAELHGDDKHEDDDHGEEHDHDHEEHGEKEDHDDHEEHDHEEDAATDSHSEFHAEYQLTCEDPAQLTDISLTYFETFPNARALEVQLITDSGARKIDLTEDSAVINLN